MSHLFGMDLIPAPPQELDTLTSATHTAMKALPAPGIKARLAETAKNLKERVSKRVAEGRDGKEKAVTSDGV
jgi:hypothetical protein